MLPDRVSNPGPLTYESGALPIALRGPLTAKTKTACVPVSIISQGLFKQGIKINLEKLPLEKVVEFQKSNVTLLSQWSTREEVVYTLCGCW